MDNRIHLTVTTQIGVVYDKMVNYVLLPMVDGGYGILADHAPMIGALDEGIIKYRVDKEEDYIAVGGGVAEVIKNEVIVMATSAEKAEDIDMARAIAAERRARERLQSKTEMTDLIRAQHSLNRSMIRQKAYDLHKEKK